MSERKQKGVKIKIPEYDQVQKIIDARDKNRFEQEGDFVAHAVRQAASVHEGDPYHLVETCGDRSLIHDGVFYICAKGGASKSQTAKMKKPMRFKVASDPMSFEGVKAVCVGCFWAGKGLDAEKQLEVCGGGKMIREGSTLVCIGGGPTMGVHKDGARPYPFAFGKEPMSSETVRRICSSACIYVDLNVS